MTSFVNGVKIEDFPTDDIPVIIQDVLDACFALVRPMPKIKRPEEDLSKQVFQTLRRLPRYLSGPLEPQVELWLPALDARADIKFSCGKGIETYFIFEAKRLFISIPSKKTLLSEYVSEGMCRFISGKYAPFQHASAMLAYVYDKDISEARKMVGEKIEKEKTQLNLRKSLCNSTLSVVPPVSMTCHALTNNRSFTLYHLFTRIPEPLSPQPNLGKNKPPQTTAYVSSIQKSSISP